MKLINFICEDGVELNGLLYESSIKTQDIILSVHGMSSNCFKQRDVTIANKAIDSNIDYFCFNNRGSDLISYVNKYVNGTKQKIISGTSFEDVVEGYYDIVGAISKLKELGYKNIYLQGHSLGCTKIVYTYNKLKENNCELLDNIKGIILLSLVDVTQVLKTFLGDKYNYYLNFANQLEKEGKTSELMPKESFIHPISVKSFLRYIRDYKDIDINEYKVISNIEKPLFMRWGTENEMIIQKPEELVKLCLSYIKHKNKDIGFIQGADHGYGGKEEILAKQIINFVKNIEKDCDIK